MANFFVTYDLNGSRPSHREMDDHLHKVTAYRARVLETVWWVDYHGTAGELRNQVQTILGREDLLLVIEAKDAAWTNLLVDNNGLIKAWRNAA